MKFFIKLEKYKPDLFVVFKDAINIINKLMLIKEITPDNFEDIRLECWRLRDYITYIEKMEKGFITSFEDFQEYWEIYHNYILFLRKNYEMIRESLSPIADQKLKEFNELSLQEQYPDIEPDMLEYMHRKGHI